MRLLTPLVAVALVALLAACGPDAVSPPPVPAPEPTATSPFADEAEALAAAEEAYAAYLAMADRISSEGGIEPERIAPYVSEERAVSEIEAYRSLGDDSLRIVGNSTFVIEELTYFDDAEVQVRVCLDIEARRLIDSGGNDVTPPDRQSRPTMLILLQIVDQALVVDKTDIAGSGSC